MALPDFAKAVANAPKEASLGANGALNLKPPAQWSRKAFADEMTLKNKGLPMRTSVMEQLRQER
jgi:hypothetical protein